MNHTFVVSIILITFGILFIPFISKILKIPVAVGEILYGMFIGESVLNVVSESQWLDFLSSFGFLLLMFLSGLEVNLSKIKALALREKFVVIVIPFLVFLVSFSFGDTFGLSKIESIAVGVISVGVVVTVLREKELLETKLGRILFLTGISGEILSITVLTVFSIVFKFGLSLKCAVNILEIILYLLLARIILVFLKSFVWWYPNRMKFYFEKSPSEIGVRLSLAVMFVLSAAATLINVEPILGAFIGGLIFSSTFRNTEIIEEKLSGISFGFLIPIFFIYVGIKFKIPEMNFQFLCLVLTIVALSYISKLIPSLLLTVSGLKLRNSIASGFLLSAPLTLVVVTAEFGKSIGAINSYEESALIMAAVIMGIFSPIIFSKLGGEPGESHNP
jgi:Kef-type K+ transport system membrane component KefB